MHPLRAGRLLGRWCRDEAIHKSRLVSLRLSEDSAHHRLFLNELGELLWRRLAFEIYEESSTFLADLREGSFAWIPQEICL